MTTSARDQPWCWAAAAWSLVFAAPHVYWAAGGRAGLGSQAAAADAALAQPWFATYNLAAAGLAVLGAGLAAALARRWGGWRLRRWLLAAAVLGSAVLLLRGLLGLALLAADPTTGETPPILLAIEPWFVLGGLAYGLMAREQHSTATSATPSPPRR